MKKNLKEEAQKNGLKLNKFTRKNNARKERRLIIKNLRDFDKNEE